MDVDMKFGVFFATGFTAMTMALPLMIENEALAISPIPMVSQLPGDPLPGDPAEQSFDENTDQTPSLEDAYARGQQIGQSVVASEESFDPLSVCQHLTSNYAQQCLAGYHDGYGADLSSNEVTSYYYAQGYAQGAKDAQAGNTYNPSDAGYQNLPDNTTRKNWSDGYHEGYWEHI